MKRILLGIIAVAASVMLAGSASAVSIGDYGAGTAANGIAGSRHNMGAFGKYVQTDGTSEICVFCHAPHHGGTNAPLWNKGVPTGFTSYGTTLAGTTVGAPGGATLACLSCHDGVSTFDTLINAPGKGNGGSNNKIATDMGWVFKMPILGATALQLDHFGDPNCGICHNSASKAGPVRMNIGTDLRDDHPVSVTYTAGKGSLRPTSDDIATIDLTSGLATTNANISQNRWAVGGAIVGPGEATIADLLRGGKVECSSCHDPHFSNKSWDEVESTFVTPGSVAYCGSGEGCSDGLFLRRVGGNTGSGVCRTCHNK
jgi:hypothetical protein